MNCSENISRMAWLKRLCLVHLGCLVLAAVFSIEGISQSALPLDDAIAMAKKQALASKLADTRLELSKNEYQIFRAGLKPQISLFGNAPVYSKTFATVTQPDGTISFEPVKQVLSTAGIGLSQKIPFTGGDISFNTDLTWFRDMRNAKTLYNGTPFYIQLNQPLFAVNALKWQKQIAPLRLREAEKQFAQELAALRSDVVLLYFDVLSAQINRQIADTNLVNTTYNYELEKKRIDLGTTNEDKLLQLELQVLNSRQQAEQARYQYELGLLALKNLLGIKDTLRYVVQLPSAVPQNSLPLATALELAAKNRPEYLAYERSKLQAQQAVAEAKAATHQVNLMASYGLNRADPTLAAVYRDPQNQQMLSLGFNVPIVSWGRREAALRTAEALEKLTSYTNAQQQNNMEQEIVTLVNNLQLLYENLGHAEATNTIAQRRYAISNRLYQTGKMNITEFIIAQQQKDEAQRNYLNVLSNYWKSWYKLMELTGWEGS